MTPVQEAPTYVVVGRGHWARRMESVLAGEGRRVHTVPEARCRPDEQAGSYQARMGDALRRSGADIAWLCVPPGPHMPALVGAALSAGLHVVAEKPWMCSTDTTAELSTQADQAQRLVGVHYEYCLLDGVTEWRDLLAPGLGCRFGGSFDAAVADRVGIPARWNLGSHVAAIREYAVPSATLEEIRCGYERPRSRRVWLASDNDTDRVVDFSDNSEPIIQRFARRFEDAVGATADTSAGGAASFPFDLAFATRVAAAVSTATVV